VVKVVFFDAAGTLFDTRQPAGSIYAQVARRHGVNVTDQEVNAAFRRVFHAAPGLAFGVGHSPQELRRLEKNWWRRLVEQTFSQLARFDDFDAYFEELFELFAKPETWSPAPDALDVLQALKRRNHISLGIISNFDARVYGILSAYGMLEYLDSVTISSEAGYAKPAPEIFRIALEKHSVAPNEALHVGDSPALDVQGASAVGIGAVLYDPRSQWRSAIPGAIGYVKSLQELLSLVEVTGQR